MEGKLKSIKGLLGVAAAGVLLFAAVGATPASAEVRCGSACMPWWRLNSQSYPANLPPGGVGLISVLVQNLGDKSSNSTPVTLTDKLPEGLEAKKAFLRAVSGKSLGGRGLAEANGREDCTVLPREVTCIPNLAAEGFGSEGGLRAYGTIEFEIEVKVAMTAHSGEENKTSISGGGTSAASVSRPITVSSAPTLFGIEQYELRAENANGTVDTQAGSHPFQLTTNIELNQGPYVLSEGKKGGLTPPVKDLRFNLPPGVIGNPTPFPQCKLATFLKGVAFGEEAEDCPLDTVVGVASVTAVIEFLGARIPLTTETALYSLPPSVGEPARFGFIAAHYVPVYLDTAVRTGGDYGITVTVHNISEFADFVSSRVTFWGVPGDPRHDASRGLTCLGESPLSPGCNPTTEVAPPPFMTLPTACAGPVHTTAEVDSWLEEGVFTPPFEYTLKNKLELPIGMDGCNQEPFTPSIRVTPDGLAGSTPTGLTVDEHVPQESSLNPTGLAESSVKGLSVTLPEGVALNPAGADGLQACPMEGIALQSPEVTTCPEAAKVATATIRTPLLSEPMEGAAYLAVQNANPFGSLVALYLYAEAPVEGIRAKATGELQENPVTGQLTAHFEGDPLFQNDPRYAGEPAADFLPEVPFEDIELHFFGGDRAPLVTPAKCGAYATTGTFTPWSENGKTESSSTFNVVSGPNGSPCHDPLPFKPTLTTGTTSIQAGGFSPFIMTMSREDGEQNLEGISLKFPLGMSGTLSTVKLCGEQQADEGTCGPETEIGETIISVGVGGDPFTVKGGKVYITGPYKGAPFGLSIVNPAVAGPFNLGKVVVRAKVEVAPETAALTITTDTEGPYKIPTILDGIPLEIKHVLVNINRHDFTFNATNCSPLQITATLTSTEGATSTLAVPYQVTNCAVLAFKPKLDASTSGKTSRADGASLTVKLSYPAGPYDANIARVKVELPRALPAELRTLQKACTAAVFAANPANCPPQSIVGYGTATTPVVPVPLSGPAYFVSHGGETFPSLVIVLQGYGVTVELVGSTFIDQKTGILSSTFKTIPDTPVGTFELTLPQGPYSALAANGNLCNQNLEMPTEFIGQNGALIQTTSKIAVTGCKLSIGVVRHAVHGRRATIAVSVPSAGTLVATGAGLSRGTAKAGAAGTVTVGLELLEQGAALPAPSPRAQAEGERQAPLHPQGRQQAHKPRHAPHALSEAATLGPRAGTLRRPTQSPRRPRRRGRSAMG